VSNGIAVHSKVVWVLDDQRLLFSDDGGRTFQIDHQPCVGRVGFPDAVTDDGSHTYLLCAGEGYTGHVAKYLYRASGPGSTWARVGRPPSLGDIGQMAAGSDRALVIAAFSGASWLYRSNDGGQRWRTALTEDDGGQGWEDLGFITATNGFVIHGPAFRGRYRNWPGQLLLTGDGGRTWRSARF
jgi:photosystem II stability/assembly factor-like uncharacterized protein